MITDLAVGWSLYAATCCNVGSVPDAVMLIYRLPGSPVSLLAGVSPRSASQYIATLAINLYVIKHIVYRTAPRTCINSPAIQSHTQLMAIHRVLHILHSGNHI